MSSVIKEFDLNPRGLLQVPKGTIEILKTKRAIGITHHSVTRIDIANASPDREELHTLSLGEGVIISFFYDAYTRATTIKWRDLSEEEVSKRKSINNLGNALRASVELSPVKN